MHNKLNGNLLLVFGLLIGLSLLGCQTLNKMWNKTKEKVNILPALPEGHSLSHLQFDDIPVPRDFKHQPKESVVYMHGGLRTAHIKYSGSARVENVVDFYLKQMPQQKWIFKTSLELDKKKKLLFEKGSERCEVIIENKGRDSYLDIMINHK